MIHKISGKQSSNRVHPLHVNNNHVSDVPGIAHVLGQTFSANSSSQQYNANFQSSRSQAERRPLSFNSSNLETYNFPFSISELTSAISKSRYSGRPG